MTAVAEMISWRMAGPEDAALLGEMNRHLILDEGHRNPMTIPELQERMRLWLQGEYQAVFFEKDGEPIAYGLYRDDGTSIYLRHFFVGSAFRRAGIGTHAFHLLRREVWPAGRCVAIEVLLANQGGVAFWRSVGGRDYSLSMIMEPLENTAA